MSEWVSKWNFDDLKTIMHTTHVAHPRAFLLSRPVTNRTGAGCHVSSTLKHAYALFRIHNQLASHNSESSQLLARTYASACSFVDLTRVGYSSQSSLHWRVSTASTRAVRRSPESTVVRYHVCYTRDQQTARKKRHTLSHSPVDRHLRSKELGVQAPACSSRQKLVPWHLAAKS